METLRKGLPAARILIIAAVFSLTTLPAWPNETGLPADMAKIVGQEDFVYVWTLGTEGVGDEQDKLVTIAVNPDSPQYGKVVQAVSVGGRNEAHHMGLTQAEMDQLTAFLESLTGDNVPVLVRDAFAAPIGDRE